MMTLSSRPVSYLPMKTLKHALKLAGPTAYVTVNDSTKFRLDSLSASLSYLDDVHHVSEHLALKGPP